MISNKNTITSRVSVMGAAARSGLPSGQRGKVLAVVARAAYLLTEAEEVVWLATAASPMHRRGMQVSAPLPRLAVDTSFTVIGQALELESGPNFDFRSSRTWGPPAIPAGEVMMPTQLPEKLQQVYAALLSRITPVGFGAMIQPVLRIVKSQTFPPIVMQETNLMMSAWPVVDRIARACLAHAFEAVLQQAEGLIGWGEGLTPSGDDFLGGLFFGWHMLARTYPQFDYLGQDIFPTWIDAFRPHTNPISFALLKDNSLGHAVDPLDRFGAALLTDRANYWAVSAASELTTLGHSTGWDMLAGFLVGMLPTILE
jgi:hypothetical protein